MITTSEKEFESKNFAIQIIAHGGFVDSGGGDGKRYYVETINLRVNPVVQGEYFESRMSQSGNDWAACFETKEEWEADNRKREKLCKEWEEKVKSDLKAVIPNICDGSCLIQRVQSEVFAVMHVYEIAE
jgi:hypothetical protein